jgi:hypothetical protein
MADLSPEGDSSELAASNELARSLGTVWQRFSGARPKSTNVEIDRNAVRCVIEEGPEPTPADTADAEAGDGGESPALTTDSMQFQRDASAAVTRAVGRRVTAFIPSRDEAGTAQHTFILDSPRKRY